MLPHTGSRRNRVGVNKHGSAPVPIDFRKHRGAASVAYALSPSRTSQQLRSVICFSKFAPSDETLALFRLMSCDFAHGCALNHVFTGFPIVFGMLGGRTDAACSITGGINNAHKKASDFWTSCRGNNWFLNPIRRQSSVAGGPGNSGAIICHRSLWLTSLSTRGCVVNVL